MPQDASKMAQVADFARFWEDFWKILGKILLSNMPPQTYFRKKPASTNSISKKANLKNRGPAVIAAGVGNPPAPALGRAASSVIRMEGQKRPNLAFRLAHAHPPNRRGHRIKWPKMALKTAQDAPRCRFLPILSPSFWHLFFNAFLDRFLSIFDQLGANLAFQIDQNQ